MYIIINNKQKCNSSDNYFGFTCLKSEIAIYSRTNITQNKNTKDFKNNNLKKWKVFHY
jgi:hypothetical protein